MTSLVNDNGNFDGTFSFDKGDDKSKWPQQDSLKNSKIMQSGT